MDRQKLIDSMEQVEPALAMNQLMPVLSHFWFTGKSVMAFNDQIALSMVCETDFIGAVPQTLLSILKTSPSPTVDFEVKNKDTLGVKIASSRLKVAIMPEEDFAFKMPKFKGKDSFPVDAGEFIRGLQTCLGSIGNDTSSADYQGVTLIKGKKRLLMFATDRGTVSHASVRFKGDIGFSNRVILPTGFCRELIRICKGSDALRLEIDEDKAIARHRGVTLFGQLIAPDKNPVPFLDILRKNVTDDTKQHMTAIPEKMQAMLERACIVANAAVDKSRTVVTVKDSIMTFESVSERGEVRDTVKIDAAHADIVVHVDARRVLDGCAAYERMIITDDCLIMMKENLVYMVSATRG